MELDSNERAQIRQQMGDTDGYILINDLGNVYSRQDMIDYLIKLAQGVVIDTVKIADDAYEDGYNEGFRNGTYED